VELTRTWHAYLAWHTGSTGTLTGAFRPRDGFLTREMGSRDRKSVNGVAGAVKTARAVDFVAVADTDRGKIWTGVATDVRDFGDENVSGDERCTGYNTHWRTDSGLWIAATTRTTTWSGACGTGTQLSQADTYDDAMTSVAGTGEDANLSAVLPVKTVTFTGAATSITATATYDPYGRVIDSVDGNGHATRTTYTPATGVPTTMAVTGPRPDGTTNADGSPAGFTATTTLDAATGLATAVTDANGGITTLGYDGLSRLTSVRKPGQQASGNDSITYAYTLSAQPYTAPATPLVTTKTLQTDAATPVYVTSYAYADGFGRTIQTQADAPGGGTGRVLVNTRYDDRGNIAGVSGPLNDPDTAGSGWVHVDPAGMATETRTSYDPLGRSTATQTMGAGVVKWQETVAYDGNLTSTQPPSGGRVDDVLDARGHVVTVKEYNTDGTLYAATSLGYDPADRLTTVTSPKGAKSSYGYDWTGRRVSSNDPDTGNTNVTTAFDALNRPTQRVAANRQLAGDAGHGRVYMPSVWRSSGLAPWAIRSTPGGRAPGVARVLGTFA
jgi:YD repeat-containing protein